MVSTGILSNSQCPLAGILRRDGRAAEGAPLLRAYGVKSSIEGANPSLSASIFRIARKLTRFGSVRIIRVPAYAPVAQLDRVPGYEPGGREFESLRARQINKKPRQNCLGFLFEFLEGTKYELWWPIADRGWFGHEWCCVGVPARLWSTPWNRVTMSAPIFS